MRAFVLATILALSALAPPMASAAEPLLSDAAGDAQVAPRVAGAPAPAGPGAGDSAAWNDLLALDAAETLDAIVFTVTVASLQGDPAGVASYTELAWGDAEYAVQIVHTRVFGQESRFASLLQRQGNDWEVAARLDEPAIDGEAGTLTAEVPKVYLVDGQRRTPGRGDSLEILRVRADSGYLDFGVVELRYADAMPDEGAAGVPLTLAMGDHSTGNLVLTTSDRVRVSNGGATTFVFELTLRNLGETEEEYALAATDLPADWKATLRSPVKVPPRADKTVSLLVSVPFAHEHGGYSSFNVTAQAAGDAASSARMRLGVLHTPIPQPAGHHSELFLHARDPRAGSPAELFSVPFPFAYGWMNTQAEDPEDAEYIVARHEGDDRRAWYVPLSPSLEMGLDFDVDRTGLLEASIRGQHDGPGDVAAELFYYQGDPDNAILLAHAKPVGIALTQQAATPFKLTMVPTLDADYIAYAPDSGMYLRISLVGANPADQIGNTPLRPQLETAGFKLALPLLEYHDKLSGESEAAQAVTLVAKSVVEKAARPGSVLTYVFDVRNDGAPDTFVLDLAGNDVAHARLVPRGHVELATGETREVTLAVEIPVSANAGQEFEVLLFVHARDDPSKMAIARTKTKATDVAAEALPDESADLLAAQARENQAPAPGLALLAGLALGAALMRRRRV